MSGKAAKPKSDWSLCRRYDWGAWSTWRAAFMTAAIAGAGIGAIALLADLVVAGILGMDLGQGGLSGADILAFALALGLFAPGLWMWIRILENEDREADHGTAPSIRAGFKEGLLEASIFLSWFLSAFAVFLVVYRGTNLIAADGQRGSYTSLLAVGILVGGNSILHAGLRKMGAKPRPSDRTGP